MVIRRRPISLLIAALAGITVAVAAVLATAPTEVWAAVSSVKVVGSSTTVRPDLPTPTDAVTPPAPYKLTAAKNEFESFQVVIEAGDQPITGLRVKEDGAGDPDINLKTPDGATIANSNVTVYREHFINIGDDAKEYASDGEGATGLWPDALIPEKDYIYGEDRSAFPTDVPADPAANNKAVVWVDVLVPKTAKAGNYEGSLTLTATGGLPQNTVPVNLEVLNFELPSTSSLQNAFLTRYGDACLAHTGDRLCNDNREQRWRLHSLYARAALENRVTISNPVPLGVNEGPPTGQNLTYFNQYIAPLLKSDVQNPLRLPNAKLTSFNVFTYDQKVDPQYGQVAHCKVPECTDQWETFANSNGFADRMFWYSCDEPGNDTTKWANCRTALTDQTNLPKLVTSTVNDATTSGYLSNTDIIAPVVNRMDDKAAPYQGNQREKYDAFLAADANNRLWMYTSNMSFGSNGPDNDSPEEPWNHPYWNGWPGYAIDQPATQARAMGWMTFKYDATGELYWQTTEKLATAWTNQYEQGGNGDGTLFYPGKSGPNGTVGGPVGTDIAVESIRLKRIRDGREDYEYLKFLADRGKRSEADAIATRVFPVMYDATATQTELDSARNDLIGLIKPLLPPIIDPHPTDCEDATSSSAGVTGAGTWADPLRGTPGEDVIVGTANDDVIEGLGSKDLLCGGGGYDSFRGGPGNDTIDGEDASNAVLYEGGDAPAGVGVNVNLATGEATGHGTDKLFNINEVYGTPNQDAMVGDAEQNYLAGGDGDDSLNGGDGSDGLVGGLGSDRLNSRDGVPDEGWGGVQCGGGTDYVTADAKGVDLIAADCEPENVDYQDTTAPRVKRVVPAENATGVAPGANVSAFFSEAMRPGSINTNTVRLYRAGTTTALPAAVGYDAVAKKALLDPEANLERGARYKAVVTAGARDLAGNRLDQNPSVTGNQPKVWFFTVRN